MFSFKNIKRGVFLLNKIKVKILWVHIHTSESYWFILVTKLRILVQLLVDEKMVK